MRIEEAENIYFVGIGGIGMSALARYFNAQGKRVAGYDRSETELTNQLQSEGIAIHYEDDPSTIPHSWNTNNTLVVYTPAVPDTLAELDHFRNRGYMVQKRAEVLGRVTKACYTVAVAGTHGKTTTSVIIAHILNHAGLKCNAFLGGISTNYNTNVLIEDNAKATIVEADEYDRSFLQLHPDIAVVTSMEADHLDIYGSGDNLSESFQEFVNLAARGTLFAHHSLKLTHRNQMLFMGDDSPFRAVNIRVNNGQFEFNAITPKGVIDSIKFPLPGRHNIANAMAGIAVAQELGIDNSSIKDALECFAGVKRRFEFQIRTENLVFIDDYAHHPSELEACINAVKELYPTKKITGIFQPHLYSRTRDFADGFAKSLSHLNEVILLDIYPAREEPIEGVSSTMLLNNITSEQKELVTKKKLVENISDRTLEVLLTLGAGDIDQLVQPIKEQLIAK